MKHVLHVSSIAIAFLASSTAHAHPYYAAGCQDCHGGYRTNPYKSKKGGTWPTSLHELHRSSTYMDADCNLCHVENGDRTSMSISGKGYGCNNCHGTLHGGVAEGRGLREHHRKSGADDCAGGCHPADETPLPESVKPPAYGVAGSKVDDPCNLLASTPEDWSGDGWGLDNDGDLLHDGQDPDCGGTVNLPPVADFTFSAERCSARVQFTDASSDPDAGDAVAKWSWDFGNDGSVDAAGASPVHDFPGAGTYPVKLTVEDGSGATASKVADVAILANAPPAAAFDVQVGGDTASFADQSTDGDGTIASRQWTFGDGASDATASPNHAYASPGTYEVVLVVTDDCGGSASATRSVTIAPVSTSGFIRGDCNHDTKVDITDAVATLAFLFMGEANACPGACNADDSDALDLTDAIYTLTFLFVGGQPIPAPYPACGPDPTADDIRCEAATCP